MEYQINDTVMYGADGVCIISEITERKIGTEIHKYYILKPVYDNKSTIMVPFANEHLVGKMKELLNGDEIRLALETAQKAEFDNVEDDSLQKEAFHKAIDNSDLLGLLRLTKHYTNAEKSKRKKASVFTFRMRECSEKRKKLFLKSSHRCLILTEVRRRSMSEIHFCLKPLDL